MGYVAQGRKEVGEAVLIAALNVIIGELIRWGVDVMKARRKRKEETAIVEKDPDP